MSSLARRFHDETTHSPASVRTSGHTLDWDIKPFPFKVYTESPALPLPRELDPLPRRRSPRSRASPRPRRGSTLEALAALLYYSAGRDAGRRRTRAAARCSSARRPRPERSTRPRSTWRPARSTGSSPGLYHFCPGDFALRRLRGGDVRAALAAAAAEPALARRGGDPRAQRDLLAQHVEVPGARLPPPLLGLRHDAGQHAGGRGRARPDPARAHGLRRRRGQSLLGLDPMARGGAGAGGARTRGAGARRRPGPLPSAGARRDAAVERRGRLSAPARDVTRPRASPPPTTSSPGGGRPRLRPRAPSGPLVPLPAPRAREARSLGETIQRRGSTREFGHEPLSARGARDRAVGGHSAARRPTCRAASSISTSSSTPSRAWRPAPTRTGPTRTGSSLDHRRTRSATGRRISTLEQALGGDAAAVIFFLAPLDAIGEACGDRGYRLANLEAGMAGGRAYLAAYAQGFGASGLTFYDSRRRAVLLAARGRARRDLRHRARPLGSRARRRASIQLESNRATRRL